ncbi:MAG: PEP-CTERM sorting domain-containing protein [Armatimonadetes bacterium]|nr:PEP-CTERM sorting domain-containing protein [Armatimonadota bacterium]
MVYLRSVRSLFFVASLSALTALSYADFGGPMFKVIASNAAGTGSFEAQYDSQYVTNSGQGYFWSLPEQVDIRNDAQEIIATLMGAVIYYSNDPLISLGFSVGAGASTTHFSIWSATMSFATIANPTGQTSAGVTVTDVLGDTASFTGSASGTNSYRALYNGVPGSEFHSALASFGVGANGSLTHNDNYGWVNVGAPVSDMTAHWDFRLSSFDFAGGTSRYEVLPVPEPSMLAALALGFVGCLRRRR